MPDPAVTAAAPDARRPVIAIAGLAIETSTFTPTRTLAPAFHPDRGDEVVARYPFLASYADAAEFRGALIGHALPGGVVARPAYEELADEIVARLTEIGPVDGLWYDIHGAMVVEGLDDAETDLLGRIRAVVGPDVIVSASMDLHGNVTRELAHQVDLVTCYRTAPHEDTLETKERAVRNLVDVLTTRPVGGRRPVKAWIPIPVLLPGEQTSTRIEPAASIYGQVPEVEQEDGVLDAAIWVGYAWADQPRDRAVTVVTGWDRDVVAAGAERLARAFWDAREDFVFVAPTGSFDECLAAALAPGTARPFFVSDSGDNPTAGGSGDMTWGLTQVLAHPAFATPDGPTVIYASVPGPAAVAEAVAAGVGATVTVTAGAEVDDVHAGPITMTGRVHAVEHGDRDAETEVVLQVGSVFAILTTLRKPYHHEHDFTDLDLDPRRADVVVVKIGYLEPELFDMAADWMLALTPGGVDQDLLRLGHHRIERPLFPYDREFATPPDLSARIVPPSNEPLGAA
ncbi:M81 family metallopeptidase [Curtobacterium sp. ODYSSEY 48 V2]|uniref:M81 family metallopeptidase n=1 Tax=Curtobacterium sp. ODYSSEY 48 V2 TaxID=2939561 RepID=UPI00203B21A0|nr:M81 family metallopeptidase [Curtobacterium sp. ODYSSEY 48 V2]MCM3503763.1 M81 family metallopeptidase [Curtobacterium sp. ODYSSEY 48 V2]